ncbi:ABC transporter substrate-binding protein [Pseudoroseomonas deserti]|uniref:ABC transporter substrate-binding protein n=1 Tax=Teichococcus deserti TaxID=1817963 RepID=A0A1V2GZD3_9PROT|nr:tripartite tricarboxylate transporter substrate binding protein [Pseudoroseomonas deserti]ONG50365.1 ABC transporter substrate-binding protein [Pseudoroseomonas deserti]
MPCPTLSRRHLLPAAGALLGVAGAGSPTCAQGRAAEPPLRWVVAYPPGGGTDLVARLVGQAMGAVLGRGVVVENRPGGATLIAAEAVARAAPDGQTLFTADAGTLVFNAGLFRRLPYDPRRDFRPLGGLARFGLVLAASRRSGLASVRQALEQAVAAPGRLDCASPGLGSPHHLAMERLARLNGLSFHHVPYRGAAPALNDLMAGTVGLAVTDYATAGAALRDGLARPLAVFSADRLPALPGVPTLREALGERGFAFAAWQALVLPAATPDAVAAPLAGALQAALRMPLVRGRLAELGGEAMTEGPAAMQALLAEERAAWLPLVEALGLRLDG